MKHKTRTIALSWLLSLALTLSLLPGMSLTANAAPTETLLTTITATAKEQASYSTAGVATVSFSFTTDGSSAYMTNWGWWGYGWTATVNAAEGYTITKCVFYDDANRTATDSEAPFVVETTDEDKTPQVNGTPILAYTSKGIKKIEVYGYATPAAGEDTSTYTLTIPSTLTVANSGWNDAGGISATGTLASGKKLTVTASSANSWALKSGDNSVGYKLATASTDTEATTSWEFTELSNTATTKPMGIIVEDYSTKPAGTYQDTVTFTAKVEDAAPATITVTWNNSDISGSGKSFTKDGVTMNVTGVLCDFDDKNFSGGAFTSTVGNFTKIEVTANSLTNMGSGWSVSGRKATWTGTASSTVSFGGSGFMDGIWGMGDGVTMVFTIEPAN